jgi:hypothetical protein
MFYKFYLTSTTFQQVERSPLLTVPDFRMPSLKSLRMRRQVIKRVSMKSTFSLSLSLRSNQFPHVAVERMAW